ncbi:MULTISPECIES: hypothetical protein [unclassified Kitasatospora]|uniref:hypothetical protein n=1 Tax=unclassified Kitasatospora TaxID=2633591 RepID=UPI00070AAE62|nr:MULTISPECIES: hypothetical protein [unclassified Kitasatospora]KQV20873.1 hypothetical protein ASC99_20405 [Kitasatospora sp. Root107]KRB60473.1 hypothetical protein ASE03_12775 [Kitasatospora sp. Root187]
MYELNRVLLRNFGPRDARYEWVDLDLSGVGEPVSTGALVPDAGHVPDRPSPASLVMLENGGGKGVLLTAIMCTTIPYRHKDLEALRKFVVSPVQPSHIVMEWVDARTGQLLVTGQVLAPAADKNLSRLFYSFHPGAALTADRLPFHHGGIWLSFDDFCTELRDLRARNEGLGLREEAGQKEWEAHQSSLGLEPDLFNVQRAMNATESGAANAFTTTTSGAFVEWLLKKSSDASDYDAVGKMFNGYAGAISQYQLWQKERAFALEMQRQCQQVDDAHTTQLSRAAQAAQASKNLVVLASALLTRDRQLACEVAVCGTAYEQADVERRTRMRAQDAADNTLRHVEWHSLRLDLADLEARRADAEARRLEVEQERDGWAQVPLALDLATARHAFDSTHLDLTQAEGAIAPYATAADDAAARLRIGLRLEEEAVRKKIRDLQEATRASGIEVSAWRARMGELRKLDGFAESETASLSSFVAQFEADLQRSRDSRDVLAGEAAADAATRSRAMERDLEEQADDAKAAVENARTSASRARVELSNADVAASAAGSAADNASTVIDKLRTRARHIQRDPLSSELLETEPEATGGDALTWIAAEAGPLHELASRRHTALEGVLTAQRRRLDRDQEYLTALDTSAGLLPARAHVREVCDALLGHGVIAHPGWIWMRDNLPTDLHARAISDHPDLVDGVIVTDESELEKARQFLEELRPLPAAAVAIGTGNRFANMAPSDRAGRTVVEPTPAMHDELAAAREREIVEVRIRETSEEIQQQETRRKATARLLGTLDNWQEEIGEVPLDIRLDELESLQAAAGVAREAAGAASERAQGLELALGKAESQRETALDLWTAQQRTADGLERLAGREAEAGRAADRISELVRRTTMRAVEFGELEASCSAAEDESLRRAGLVQTHELEADGHSREWNLTTATDEAERRQAQAGALHPLPVLRQQYKQAASDLRAREVGEDLRKRARTAEADLRTCQALWKNVPTPVQDRAQVLAQDARADDAIQRDALVRSLTEQRERLQTDETHLNTQRAGVQVRLEQARPAEGQAWLEEGTAHEWTPSDRAQAQKLLATSGDLKTGADRAARTAGESFSAAGRAKQQAERSRTTLAPVLALFETAIKGMPIDQEAAPYPGSLEGAESKAREAVSLHATAHKQKVTADRAVERAVADLKDAVSNVAYHDLDIPLRTQISALDGRRIPPLAADWVTALTERAAVLASQLNGVEQVRDTLVLQLAGRVSEELKKLDRASTFSVFPDEAGPWSNQRFLTIKYQPPEQPLLHGLIREAVQTMAAAPNAVGLKGVDVVMRCLHSAVPRGFTAKVIKPTASRTIEHVLVEDMKTIFSGGQELTGAILLYCALAALRTSPGPRSRTRHGGLLMLDNPIGRANADYLMQIQQEMATALGIQLLYTTGLSDDNATLRFPLRIQLRNDAEARSGLSLVRVDEIVRTSLVPGPRVTPDPEAPEPAGYLSTARLYTKTEAGR